MSKKVQLSPALLKQIIAEEKQKLIDLGLLKDDRLEEHYKQLTLQESRLKEKLSEVKRLRQKIKTKLNKRS